MLEASRVIHSADFEFSFFCVGARWKSVHTVSFPQSRIALSRFSGECLSSEKSERNALLVANAVTRIELGSASLIIVIE